MRVKSSLASYVAEQLAPLGRISSRAIFGGVGVFIDDRLLAIVMGEKLYLHTDKSNLDDYVARGMPQFKPYPNAFDLTTDHHEVPPEIVTATPQQLKVWGERALNAAVEVGARQTNGWHRALPPHEAGEEARERKEISLG